MTGYAGSRDYVGTSQSPQKTPHCSVHSTHTERGSESATRGSESATRGSESSFSLGCVDRCGVLTAYPVIYSIGGGKKYV